MLTDKNTLDQTKKPPTEQVVAPLTSSFTSRSQLFNRRNILQTLSLLAGFAGAIIIFILVWPDRFWLRSTSIILACFYIFWGTLTHNKTGTFSMKIFWEYAGIACLGALMLWLIV